MTPMSVRKRRELLDRLNALDSGPTEDDRRAERKAMISKAVQTEEALKWGRVSAGGMWGNSTTSMPFRATTSDKPNDPSSPAALSAPLTAS